MLNNRLAELGALEEGGAFHESLEVVGDCFGADGAFNALDDEVGRFLPAHVFEHEDAGQDDRSRVDLVLSCVFGGGAVGGFEDGVSCVVVDVGAGGDADASHAGGEGVGDVVAVEVHGGDDGVLGGAGEDLLEEGVGDDVLDDDFLAGVGVLHRVPGAAVEGGGAEVLGGDLVAPLHEGALGELHDVALVDEGDRGLVVVDRVLDRGLDEAGGAFLGDGLDADAGGVGEADLAEAVGEVVFEELLELGGFFGAVLELDAGVDVLGVFSEDDHVGLLGVLDGGGDACEVADGAEAGVEVEDLAEGDVEGADAAAGGGGEGALDADEVFGEVVEGGLGEPFAGGVVGFVAGHDLVPVDLAVAVVGLFDGGVEDELGGVPDVGAGAVAFDEGDDGVVGDVEALGGHGDGFGGGGRGHLAAPVCLEDWV